MGREEMNVEKLIRRHRILLRQAAFVTLSTLGIACVGLAQSSNEPVEAGPEPTIALIETYGLRTVSRNSVIEASGMKVGGNLREVDLAQAIKRIEAIPGVRAAATGGVYGNLLKDDKLGLVLYLGIQEESCQPLQFGEAPSLDRTLPMEIVDADDKEQTAFKIAASNGLFSEDRSEGHSLAADPDLRAAQVRYIPLAEVHWSTLVDVLHNSQDSTQRAIAAKVIAYSNDKQQAVHELMPALRDPDSAVRNNATRALSLIFGYAKSHPNLLISAPQDLVKRLVEMLDSLEWTDRNKAIALLLCIDDEELVVRELRKQAVPTLVEMSGWQSAHGAMAFMLLGRLANMDHDESRQAWQLGEQASIIARVQAAEVK
jgi:hypothetical protein